ncbi:hypothetical protein [Paraburkholderia lycopersici]|uniref:Fimbrial protein n=1 Tax=Paraburkholderia lycopersici TaxID=416944 RepID=A0A1G6HX90_9BURK|nr:hypothetical protein [Paraburkholderia lycopersici]SDB98096.1 hypothetical protein SAMN05421548_103149 [Paraburkholderia lycopersici]
MKARHDWKASVQGAVTAAGAAAALCACGAAWADGGTIRFVGAIVEPTFDIAPGRGASVAPATMAGRQDDDAVMGATTVAYSSEPGVAPSAEVSVLAANDARVQDASAPRPHMRVGFTNGAGRRVAPDVAGHYFIGASGGVLALTPRPPTGAAEASYATVLMNYR